MLVAGRPGQFGDCLSAPLIKEISHSAGRWQRFSSFRTGWRTELLSSTGHGGVMRPEALAAQRMSWLGCCEFAAQFVEKSVGW